MIPCFIIPNVTAKSKTTIPVKINLWLSIHSNCLPYQFVNFSNRCSNPSKKRLKKLVGCKSSFLPILDANQGVSVKPTNKLVSVDVTTTTENCLSISATNTCKNNIGKNTTTSTNVIDNAENPISIRPSMEA